MKKLYKSGKYTVFERQNKASESLKYSYYMLCDGNKMIFEFRVPDPTVSSRKKTMYLTYQTSVRTFLKDLIDVLNGDLEKIRTICPSKKETNLTIEHQIGRVYIVQDGVTLGEILLKDIESSDKFAEAFVQYFSGPMDEIDWESIL